MKRDDGMRILVVVDESEHSDRTVSYVGTLLRENREVEITLFHVLKPLPRQLLEHGGSEDPTVEIQLSQQLQKEREEWYRRQEQAEYPILIKAQETLGKTGFPTARVTLRFGHEEESAFRNILDEARIGGYETIVVSRHGVSGVTRPFGGSLPNQLLRETAGLTLWIVE
jgi:nucleotide-binding universal stress UspA family protein